MKVSKLKVSNSRKTQTTELAGQMPASANFHFDTKQQKIEGGPFGEKNFPKVSQCRKKIEKGDPLVSPGMVCYTDKGENPFLFSSLDQMIQFGTIKFCKTFKNYFGQFVRIEKRKKKESS